MTTTTPNTVVSLPQASAAVRARLEAIVARACSSMASRHRDAAALAIELRSVVATLEALARSRAASVHVEHERRARILDPMIEAPPAGQSNPGTLLNARYGVVGFIDELRDDELARLDAWCDGAASTDVWLLHGDGGTGKTRLLIELARRRRERRPRAADRRNWIAGFLPEHLPIAEACPATGSDEIELLIDSPQPTLVVVDSAESRGNLRQLLERVAKRARRADERARHGEEVAPLRVVLLARNAGDWWTSLTGRDELKDLLSAREPRALRPLPRDGPVRQRTFELALRDFRAHDESGRSTPAAAPRSATDATTAPIELGDVRFGRPLYVHMAALARLRGLPVDADTLLDTIVEHEQQMWLAHFRDEHRDRSNRREDAFKAKAARTVAAIVLRGGVPDESTARALNARVGGPSHETFVQFLRDLYSGRTTRPGDRGDERRADFIAGLEPDLLGEALTARTLRAASPAAYLEAVFDGAGIDAIAHGFTVLGRIALRGEARAQEWMRQLLDADLPGRALAALLATKTLAGETAFSPTADLLTEAIMARGTPALAASLTDELPLALDSVALNRLAVWVSEQLVHAVASPTTDPERRLRADRLRVLGLRLGRVRRLEDGLAATQQAVEAYRELVRDREPPEELLADLAMSLNNLGMSLGHLGRHDEARVALEEAVDLFRELASKAPAPIRPGLPMSLANLGQVLKELGRLQDALRPAREAVELFDALAETQPRSFLPNSATSMLVVAGALFALGRLDESWSAAERAIAVYRELAKERPDEFLRRLATGLAHGSAIQTKRGRHHEALSLGMEAVVALRALTEVHRDMFLADLAGGLVNVGVALNTFGRHDEALAALREAAEQFRELASDRPGPFRPILAKSLLTLGSELTEVGAKAEAQTVASDAVAILRALTATHREAFGADLAAGLSLLGVTLGDLGRREEARAASAEAVELLRDLSTTHRDALLPLLATCLTNLSVDLTELARHHEAFAVITEAVEIDRELARANPDAFLPELAVSVNNRGTTLRDLGRHEEAIVATSEAVALFRDLARQLPDGFLPRLSTSIHNLSSDLANLGRHREALRASEESVSISIPLARSRPAAFGDDLRKHTIGLKARLVGAGIEPTSSATFAEAVAVLDSLGLADGVAP
ncbi:MAG: tetratricopeptide repeat protein [Phycisphaerales bacterium]